MKKPKISKEEEIFNPELEAEKERKRLRKQEEKENRPKVTTKEFFQLLLAGYIGLLPFFLILILALLITLWLFT